MPVINTRRWPRTSLSPALAAMPIDRHESSVSRPQF